MIDILVLLLLAIPVGVLGALIGLGGGSILVPVLVVLGVPVQYAIAASLVSIIATSSGSAAASVKQGIANVKAGMFLAIFTVLGAILGATAVGLIDKRILYFAFAGFLLTSLLGFRPSIGEDGIVMASWDDAPAKWLELEGSYHDGILGRDVAYRLTRPLVAGLGMFVAGLASGLLGIGAGAFAVSIQEGVLRMPTKVSAMTSNFIIGMTALAGASVYFASGFLYVGLAAPMAVGTAIGAVAGGRVIHHVRSRTIKVIFLVVVTYLILQMLYKGVTA